MPGFFYKFLIISFFVFSFFLSDVYAQSSTNHIPEAANFVTSDVENFWKAYDKFIVTDNPDIFQDEYIDIGTAGLKDFIPQRILSAQKLAETVMRRKENYDSIRAKTFISKKIIEVSLTCFQNFKNIYPEAVFPDVYFVIGRWSSGGTATETGILIGAEVKANEQEVIPYLICHELIHYQQNYSDTSSSLLNQCIVEGSADFLGELISGGTINENTYKFGMLNEAELWNSFSKDMNGNDLKFWLYSGDKAREFGYPRDLGYFIGYKICEAYYNKAPDKKQAVYDILNIKNMGQFLIESSYGQ